MGVALIDPGKHPLLHSAAQGAQWAAAQGQAGAWDAYPACVEWADEHERWFELMQALGAWSYYLPRLRGPMARRDEELAEIAVAYFLVECCGLPILSWHPPGPGNRRGDFLVGLMPFGIAFTEVKSPGWEAEVARARGQNDPRLAAPKHINAEGWTLDPVRVREAVASAYSQLPGSIPTLIVINDDLQVGLTHTPLVVRLALYARRIEGAAGYGAEDGCFVGRQYERLGAVGILNVEMRAGPRPDFRFALYRNSNAVCPSGLPRSVFLQYDHFDGIE